MSIQDSQNIKRLFERVAALEAAVKRLIDPCAPVISEMDKPRNTLSLDKRKA